MKFVNQKVFIQIKLIYIHKNLLREFRFDIFVEYLTNNDKRFITYTLSKLKKTIGDYKQLHDFYTNSNNYYNKKNIIHGFQWSILYKIKYYVWKNFQKMTHHNIKLTRNSLE